MTVHHPHPLILARELRALANTLETNGHHDPKPGVCRCLTCAANRLGSGARGYPTSTLGDGTGTRGSDTISSTERAAGILTDHTTPNPGPWATIDHDLAQLLRLTWSVTLRAHTTIDRIVSHAPDDDPIPVGTGYCTITTCETFCRPDHKRPDNRLRSGLCPACHQAWNRAKTTGITRGDFVQQRTHALRPVPAVPGR